MIFESGQRVVFIGDSITAAQREAVPPHGDGYVSLVWAWVTAARPEVRLEWFNRGVGGHTIRDLAARWETDVVALRPDWLSVMIGINDVWRFFQSNRDAHVPVDEYEATYRRLLARAVEATGCKLILADPYLLEPDPAEEQRAMSDRYAAVVAKLAAEFGALHVRSQEAFDRVLATTRSADWSHDRIHVNLAGSAVLARSYLDLLCIDQ